MVKRLRDIVFGVLTGSVLATVTASVAQAPPVDYKQQFAIQTQALGQCNRSLGDCQQIQAQVVAGLLVPAETAKAEERARIAKENPGKAIDAKTAKIIDLPTNGKGGA